MKLDVGRFTDEEPPSREPEEEPETPHVWDEADEGDRLYDLMVEDRLIDRANWPGNQDTHLLRVVQGPETEDDLEMARRRPFWRDAA